MKNTLELNGIAYRSLFTSQGLQQLDQHFLNFLLANDVLFHKKLLAYRERQQTFSDSKTSELLVQGSHYLETFLANLFGIEDALSISQIKTTEHNPIAQFKKYFVLRRAKKEINRAKDLPSFDELSAWLSIELAKASLQSDDKELAIALLAQQYLTAPDKYQFEIEQLVKWCTQALITIEGQAYTHNWSSFKIPQRIDYQALVPVENHHETLCAPKETLRLRDGFKLTDPRMSAREIQDEVNYCIYCHDHAGDFCSRGFPVKKGDPSQGFKQNPLDVMLTGCPLDEKISEMNYLKQQGHTIGALAMVMIDNPMCPATGHRICNDCMKACIYQKQDPVNIPQIETRVLTDVLDLPWGVEIYDLLTRWHPLRRNQILMKPYNGLKMLIAGMGPAGFTLAHHLLLEGFAVVGFDGLKIEPLPAHLINDPIYHFADLKEALDARIMAGFGGVAEYGITVRWDKNFLKLIYLSLLRKPHFQVFGSTRFGGTIRVEDAWEMGFDHLAVAVGAGLPKVLTLPNSMAPGMRQANDFLMHLQLGNAAKSSSLTNLQIRLPAVIIGGGLTGVDTATEVQAYYITQVEKIAARYQALIRASGEEKILAQFDNQQRETLSEFLHHAKEIKQEREQAHKENRLPNFIKLIHAWGGATIVYRRSMQESPAYINNHEELQKALAEGVWYREGLEPLAVNIDNYGHAESLVCHKRVRQAEGTWLATTEEITLPARSILVATGTQPNTAYEFEHRGTFNRVNLQYQHYEDEDGELTIAHGVTHCKDPAFGPFTSYQQQDKRVSLIGDTHPVFHGNVVKAIASGMRTYPKILQLLKAKLGNVGSQEEYANFAEKMQDLFTARVQKLIRLAPDKVQIDITAPLASKHFLPGHFYRLQNFEHHAKYAAQTLLQMEPLALTASACDKTTGTLSFIIQEKNATSKIAAALQPAEAVSLMGPAGVRAKIPREHENIFLIAQASSIPFVLSYGRALRESKNKVILFIDLQSAADVICKEQLEIACDLIVWHMRDTNEVMLSGCNTSSVTGKKTLSMPTGPVIETLIHLGTRDLQAQLKDVDRVYVLGDVKLLKAFQQARTAKALSFLVKDPAVIGAVYGNMQCMLKGVCAQCWQWQIDPQTGKRTKAVFACSWQDQPLEIIDLDHLQMRAEHNQVHEILNHLWLDFVFAQAAVTVK